MDVSALASAMVTARAGQTQMAIAAKMMKMNLDSQKAALQILNAGQQNAGQLANAAAGLGQNLDITV